MKEDTREGLEKEAGMSSGRGGIKKKQNSKTKQDENEEDEVEKLLRATEDDILLKLSVDSHMSRASSSQIIHPDLDRRFQALRSSSSSSSSKSISKPPSSTANPTSNTSNTKSNKAAVVNEDNGDDLFARFAALKSTLPSYSNKNQQVEINDGDEGDEVDEVIRWAIDAAALDPSPPSDDDDVSDDSSDDQTDDEDEDEDNIKKKEKKKKKGEHK